jgi:hypothetical protein
MLLYPPVLSRAQDEPGDNPHPAAWPVREQADLTELHAQAPALDVESVCQPVKTTTQGNHYLVPNPDGMTYDLLQVYFKGYGGPNTIVIMDLGTGSVTQVHTESEYHNFHLAPGVLAPNGKLYMSILGDRMHQQVCVYDPANDQLEINAIPIPEDILGETHPMVLGQDGMIYCGGTHPSMSVTALQIDPETQVVVPYGPMGPSHAPGPCWAYTMAVDNRYIYIASGKTPWYLVAFDRETGKSDVLLENDQPDGYIGVNQNDGGASCFVRTKQEDGSHVDARYWLFQGKAIPMHGDEPTPPWPAAQPPAAQPPVPELSFAMANPDVNGEAVIWYRLPADKAVAQASGLEKPVVSAEEPPKDEVMHAAGWKAFRFTAPTFPLRIDRLTESPDGRLIGTAGHYQGNFFFEPATDKCLHPGRIGLSHYSTVVHDGMIYMSGYPNGPLFVLDPAQPWTAGTRSGATGVLRETDPLSNPRMLTYLQKAGAKKMLAAAAAGGKVYFGGVWMREGNWGGLGWWDVAAGVEGGFWKPFDSYQIRFLAAADKGRTLVISTLPVENTALGKPKPAEAVLFFLDTKTDMLSAQSLVPVPGCRSTGPVIAVGGSRVMGWTEDPANPGGASILYGVDAAGKTLLFSKNIPFPISLELGGNQWDASDFRLGPDGKIWTFMSGKLACIDPADASIEILGSTGTGGRLALAGNDLYLGGTDTLRRVPGLLARTADH